MGTRVSSLKLDIKNVQSVMCFFLLHIIVFSWFFCVNFNFFWISNFLELQVKEPLNCGAKVLILSNITHKSINNYLKHIRPQIDIQQACQENLFVNMRGGPVKPPDSFPRHWFTIFKEMRAFNPTTMRQLVSTKTFKEGIYTEVSSVPTSVKAVHN